MRLYPAWKATDGDGHVKDTQGVTTSYESRWYSSDRNDDFLMVDLGTERNISKVVIDWAAGRYATKYNIQTSLNGTNWTTVKSITANESAWTEDTFTATKARYVRMQGVQRKASEYGICEIKVYEAVDKTNLKNACEQAKNMLQNVKVDFENGSKSVGLWQSYRKANTVITDVLAGQEEVDMAVSELKAAQTNYTQKKTEYKDNIEKEATNAEKDLSGYTRESAQRYQEALKRAENLAKDADVQPGELEAAWKELEAAKAGLRKKETETPDTNPTPTPTPTPNPTPAVPSVPAKGSTFTDAKGFAYKVIKSDAKNGTVAVTGNSKRKGKMIIPATVVKDGYTFKVTEVAAKAFQNNKKMTTLVLGVNVSKIGAKSFYKNTKLKSITFKNKNAVKIGSQAFKGIKATAKVNVPKKMTAKNFNKLKKAMKSAGKKIKYKKK